MKRMLLIAAIAFSAAAYASPDSEWWIADQGGECHSLKVMFPGAQTPEEVHKGLTKRGGGPTIRHVSANVTMLEDPYRNYPPLVIARGWDRCQRIEQSFEEQRSLRLPPE
ncbi:MAG TPA: hypothetical protein VF534_01510 [Paraburkholderia sp.]